MSELHFEQVTFSGPNGLVTAEIAHPRGTGPHPAVIVLHEGIGITAHLRAFAQRLARDGYLALVPDLYSHDRARKQLSEQEVIRYLPLARSADREARIERLLPSERESARRVSAWFTQRDPSTYFPDVQSAVAFAKQHRDVQSEAIATLGFSLGGGLTAQLAASGAELAAGVIFYGQGPSEDRIAEVRYPLLGHYASSDPAITPFVRALEADFSARGKDFRAYVYADTEHGFFNAARPVYKPEAAELAYGRTLDFFAARLSSRRASVAAE